MRTIRNLALVCGLLFAALAIFGCRGSTTDGRVHVVCTTGMVAELVRQVGGEHVRITQMMGADVDPHLYKAKPQDMISLREADLILYSGLHLEGKMTDVFHDLEHENKKVVAVAERLEQGYGPRAGELAGELAVHFEQGRALERVASPRRCSRRRVLGRPVTGRRPGAGSHGQENGTRGQCPRE